MNKIEPQAWKHGTVWQRPEGRWEGDNGGNKGMGLVKEQVWMTHGDGQQCGNWLWEGGVEEGKAGENWDNLIEQQWKMVLKKIIIFMTLGMKGFLVKDWHIWLY